MHARLNQEARSWLAVLLAVTTLMALGCSREPPKEKELPARGDEAAPKDLPVPFTGTIQARFTQGKLSAADVTYTIDHRRIKREAVTADMVRTNLPGEPDLAGVIVDLERNQVILYRRYLGDRRHFVTLSLEAYRQMMSNLLSATDPTATGYSTYYLELPRNKPTVAINQKDAVTVGGLQCDHLSLESGSTTVLTDHCRQIVVDRQLVELVEAAVPAEVEGFPCRVEVYWKAPDRPLPSDGSRAERLLQQGLNAAERAAGKLLAEMRNELTALHPGQVSDTDFAPPEGFLRAESLGDFSSKFQHSSGHLDWD